MHVPRRLVPRRLVELPLVAFQPLTRLSWLVMLLCVLCSRVEAEADAVSSVPTMHRRAPARGVRRCQLLLLLDLLLTLCNGCLLFCLKLLSASERGRRPGALSVAERAHQGEGFLES